MSHTLSATVALAVFLGSLGGVMAVVSGSPRAADGQGGTQLPRPDPVFTGTIDKVGFALAPRTK